VICQICQFHKPSDAGVIRTRPVIAVFRWVRGAPSRADSRRRSLSTGDTREALPARAQAHREKHFLERYIMRYQEAKSRGSARIEVVCFSGSARPWRWRDPHSSGRRSARQWHRRQLNYRSPRLSHRSLLSARRFGGFFCRTLLCASHLNASFFIS
jgi:hypothetical protein